MSLNECIFCNISKNLLTNKSAYLENDLAFAIYDINPVTKGHTLIITKQHFPNLMECEEGSLKDAISLAKKCAKFLQENNPDIKGFNYVSNQNAIAKQVVFHLHIHVIPRY